MMGVAYFESNTERAHVKTQRSTKLMSMEASARHASSYNQHNEVQHGLGLTMIDMLDLDKSGHPISVLDLGCGTGNLTKVLSERIGIDGKVIGVDPDKGRLNVAREMYSAGNIEYIEADDKTFPEGPFDLVFASAVLHWVQDKQSLFQRVYESLRDGGRFAIVTFDGTPKVNHKVVRKIFEELVDPQFFHKLFTTNFLCLSLTEYEDLALKVGFTKVRIESKDHLDKWKNLDDCIDKWFSGLHEGAFDPREFDSEKFRTIKEEYGNKEVVYDKPNTMLYMVFSKPSFT